MSSTDTTKDVEDDNIDTVNEDIERVVISEDKKDTDKDCTSCEQNNITEGTEGVALKDTSVCVCASCGKKGDSDDMNTCNKCKEAKYCNAACKKKHRKKHKKACEKRMAEFEEALFKEHPPNEECPICLIPLEHGRDLSTFKSCCGKRICNGCIYAMLINMKGLVDKCPFCRVLQDATSNKEHNKRMKSLIDNGNAEAHCILAGYYETGVLGHNGENDGVRDLAKANELFLKAGELGCASGYLAVGENYRLGKGVEIDKTKAKYYYELAAMKGSVHARHNLGCEEEQAGNLHRAYKHYLLAARAGFERSKNAVKGGWSPISHTGRVSTAGLMGIVTSEEYANMLVSYCGRQNEMKSDARDKAAASGVFTSSFVENETIYNSSKSRRRDTSAAKR